MQDSVKQGPLGWIMRGPGPKAGETMTAHSAAVLLVGCVELAYKQGHWATFIKGRCLPFLFFLLFSGSAHLAVWVDKNY